MPTNIIKTNMKTNMNKFMNFIKRNGNVILVLIIIILLGVYLNFSHILKRTINDNNKKIELFQEVPNTTPPTLYRVDDDGVELPLLYKGNLQKILGDRKDDIETLIDDYKYNLSNLLSDPELTYANNMIGITNENNEFIKIYIANLSAARLINEIKDLNFLKEYIDVSVSSIDYAKIMFTINNYIDNLKNNERMNKVYNPGDYDRYIVQSHKTWLVNELSKYKYE